MSQPETWWRREDTLFLTRRWMRLPTSDVTDPFQSEDDAMFLVYERGALPAVRSLASVIQH